MKGQSPTQYKRQLHCTRIFIKCITLQGHMFLSWWIIKLSASKQVLKTRTPTHDIEANHVFHKCRTLGRAWALQNLQTHTGSVQNKQHNMMSSKNTQWHCPSFCASQRFCRVGHIATERERRAHGHRRTGLWWWSPSPMVAFYQRHRSKSWERPPCDCERERERERVRLSVIIVFSF